MQIRKLIQTFNHYLFYFGTIPLFLVMILTVIDVTGRYFRHPLLGTMEISQLCLVIIVSFALAHTQAEKGNIEVDLFYNMMPSGVQAVANVITSCLSLGIISLFAWRAIPWLLLSRRMTEWTDIFQLPVWLFKGAVFLGVLCLCLQLILDIIDYARELRKQPRVNTA